MNRIMPFALLASGLGAAGLSAVPTASVLAGAAPVSCELHVRSAGQGVVLEGIARSGVPVSGRYSLTIAKDGDAGSADIQQGGSFAVGAGGTSSLSQVDLSLERGASYNAVLTVHWQGGAATCRQVLPRRI
jgi:hypothetical protein